MVTHPSISRELNSRPFSRKSNAITIRLPSHLTQKSGTPTELANDNGETEIGNRKSYKTATTNYTERLQQRIGQQQEIKQNQNTELRFYIR